MEDNKIKNFKFQNKIMVFHEDPAFGRGPARIMELVRQTNKLSEAYRIMGLSSSKGWKIIKRAQNDLGFPLLTTEIGGKSGGNSKLSQEGEDFLNRYNAFVEELNKEGEKIFKKHFPD